QSAGRLQVSVTLTIRVGAYPIGTRREHGRIPRITGCNVLVRLPIQLFNTFDRLSQRFFQELQCSPLTSSWQPCLFYICCQVCKASCVVENSIKSRDFL